MEDARCKLHPVNDPSGFGAPNRRKRVFVVASLHGDARDVLLSQVLFACSMLSKEFLVNSARHVSG